MRSSGFMTTLCRSAAAGVIFAFLTIPAIAQIPGCPDKLGDQADAAIGNIKTWNAFASWYRHYAICDDGDTAESMDGVTAALLDNSWTELMHDGSAFRRSAGLQKFLVRHINAVGLTRDAALALKHRAEAHCSQPNAALCKAVEQAAQETASEQAER